MRGSFTGGGDSLPLRRAVTHQIRERNAQFPGDGVQCRDAHALSPTFELAEVCSIDGYGCGDLRDGPITPQSSFANSGSDAQKQLFVRVGSRCESTLSR